MKDHRKIRISIAAPFEKYSISHLLPNIKKEDLPEGYRGAPYLVSLVENLLERGLEISCITTSECKDKDYKIKAFSFKNFSWYVVPLRKSPFRFNGRKVGRIIDLFSVERKYLKACMNETRPDIVHSFWAYEFAWAAIDSKFPCLISVEDNPYQILKHITNGYRFLRLIMAEIVLHKTKYASTLSPYMVPFVTKRCKNVKIIPNPTKFLYTVAQIKALIQKRVEKISNPKIVMVNNGWDKRKNVHKAIDAFVKYNDLNSGATLHLYGKGYESDGPAFEYAAKFQLSNIFYYGNIPHNEILDSLKNAHLFLHSSLEESQGVVLLEAMSQGVPCIGGRGSGAVPWVINNARLLTDVTDSNCIARKILEILAESTLYKDISLNSFLAAKSKFEVEHIATQFYDYYLDIIDEANAEENLNGLNLVLNGNV